MWAWHIHHDTLCEPLLESIGARIAYILTDKPLYERPTRLRLLKPIMGKLPEALVKAGDAWLAVINAPYQDYRKHQEALNAAAIAYVKEVRTARPALLALHGLECPDCPWNGYTIFPHRTSAANRGYTTFPTKNTP